MADVGMVDLYVNVLHRPGDRHGVAACGEIMGAEWMCGPVDVVQQNARGYCKRCFEHAPAA